ncbi:MAG TPA: ATP-binding protein [Micavibrio sp.]|nr:ATP-binding protein [Micavibrio sp.]
MDELYDANMRQLAVTASGMIADRGVPVDASAFSKKWPKGEQIFLIQIWNGGTIDYSSHPVAKFPFQEKAGFGRVFFNGKKWTYYQEQIHGKTVQVSQELSERRDVIREVYNAIIIPTLIQFPVVFLLIWLLVSIGFKPLRRVSDLIQKRKADFLKPIPPGDVPDEIQTLVVALNDLLARVDTAMEKQRRFTADAAHELRTPLTAVRLQLDLLRRAGTDQDRNEAIMTLENGVSRSIHLVQQLLELARQEPEAGIEESASIDLAEITQAVIQERIPLAAAKNISLKTEIQPVSVHGNASALSVMVGNLLNNAIAYTGEGGSIFLRTYLDNGKPVLEVSDNGIGIALEDRARIFDRFYRVIGTIVPGSGLGLSIVKTIADKHGAKISVSNGLNGQGTAFRVIF